ncbi:MAG: MBL fold metallo-hydrolase [Lentisphaerae bacterium]|nr:MBL fold metallo-hydrolase [Lentisphaerota bacterium]
MCITILGSCSGTEPMPGRRHTSWILQHHGRPYCFDAGESCSSSAHLLGIELLQLRHIFISHPHLDHTGGLPNLLWTIRKLSTRQAYEPGFTLTVHTPDLEQFQAALDFLRHTEEHFHCDFHIVPRQVQDGLVLSENGLTVEARHNYHLGQNRNGQWLSFSFRIIKDGSRIVYSGDVRGLDDMGDWLNNCDLLMMETGHHSPEKICHELRQPGRMVRKLLFLHHGREILRDPEGAHRKATGIFGEAVLIAEDGMQITVPGTPEP